MNCIIVNDDISMRNTIEKLIAQADDMDFLSSFTSTHEAGMFLEGRKIDIVFFDIQMYDADNLYFIQNIPELTFVIYIPEFSPFATTSSKSSSAYLSESVISRRFNRGVNEARLFLELIKKENSNISDDYFVI
ncbi:hypothetical protein [Chryseobacterium profundimaris]|uniref:Response regulator receiver domain-containing protein n=1 Tax=Chryseobacterium profundimaris TaxID=1387275 RepID=A0ABY1PGB9_9FLAO|nr:hypothetical protein [Chryseobacterium profundimaris]SMP33502.1 Response regulator receiver domain-containing protein [Chryseobacterium profundimaris]